MGIVPSRQRESSEKNYIASLDGITDAPANEAPIQEPIARPYSSYWVSETIESEENHLGLYATLTLEEVDRIRLLQREIDQLKGNWI